jgi:hypothetical protein
MASLAKDPNHSSDDLRISNVPFLRWNSQFCAGILKNFYEFPTIVSGLNYQNVLMIVSDDCAINV